ncbi:MAG: PH domain-containing protein [Clostridiaceae bacterium]
MVFKPEKSNIFKVLLLSLIITNLIIILLFDFFTSARTRAGIAFFFFMANIIGIYYLVIVGTLRYEINDENLIISSALKLQNKKIPLKIIKSYLKSITLLNTTGNFGISSKRFCIGKGHDNCGEIADLFITSSKKAIFLNTEAGNFGISPENIEEFITRLKANGVLDQNTCDRIAGIKDFSKEKAVVNSLLSYTIILIGIMLAIPILMNLFGLLPALVDVSFFRTSGVYMTVMKYLETVMTRVLITLGLSLFFYFILNLLSEILDRYFYYLMFIPLAVTSYYLFIEVYTIIGIFI